MATNLIIFYLPLYKPFSPLKGELNPKIKFVLFERTLKITVSYLSVFDSLASFLRYFSFFDMQITHMT